MFEDPHLGHDFKRIYEPITRREGKPKPNTTKDDFFERLDKLHESGILLDENGEPKARTLRKIREYFFRLKHGNGWKTMKDAINEWEKSRSRLLVKR